MSQKPAVVVVAYNRPRALQRLLDSLARGLYPPEVTLVISIDGGGRHGREVHQIATQFVWPHGPKRLIQHEQNLGLIQHLFACGDLVELYERIILLEDDLFASPMLYAYAAEALNFYADDSRVAGISLNALWFNGLTHRPFIPYLDDGDVFFMQVAWFQGQAYTKGQWQAFRDWYTTADVQVTEQDQMHELFQTFPETDWFPIKTKYLVQSNRFYVFPRESLTTNFGDVGIHVQGTTFFQVPLQTRRAQFRWQYLENAVAVYDSFQEILPDRINRLTKLLQPYEFTVDLNGTRSLANIGTAYVLTTQLCRQAEFTFGLVLRPPVANVVEGIAGQEISFARTADLITSRWAKWIVESRHQAYYQRRGVGKRQRVYWQLGRWLDHLIT